MGKMLAAGRTAQIEAPAPPSGRKRSAPSQPETAGVLAVIAALMVIAAAVRLYRLTALGLWEDEGWTAMAVRIPLRDLMRWCAADTSPPLYYVLLHFWVALGSSDWMLRFPSVLFGVLAVPLIYLCGRTAHSERAGVIAAALLTVNTFHVRYSQEARFYSLYFFVSLWAVYFTLQLAQRPTWGRWTGWVTAATCMLYIHSTAAIYVLALSALLIALRRRIRYPVWRGWLAAHGALELLFLPWSAIQTQQVTRVVNDFWPPTPTPATLAVTAVQMFAIPFIGREGGPADLPLVAVLLALPYGAWAAWLIARRRRVEPGPASFGLLLFALTGWGLIFGFSVMVRSIYILRVLIPSLGALLLVVAITLAGVERAGNRRMAHVSLGLMLLSGCLSLGLYYRFYQKQDIRGIAQYLLQQAQQEEGVACVENRFRPALEHYLAGGKLAPCPFSLSSFARPSARVSPESRAQLAADIRGLPAFWLVEIDDTHSAPLNRATEEWLGTFMQPAGEKACYAVRAVQFVPRISGK